MEIWKEEILELMLMFPLEKLEKLGTRCEIKNVNSIKFIQQAIEYEAKRQVEILKVDKNKQETRLFDPNNFETRSMRGKEESHDYRYFRSRFTTT